MSDLRQSFNTVNVTGILKEMEIEEKKGVYQSGKKKGESYEKLEGTLTIEAGDCGDIVVSVSQNKTTNAGGENKLYKALDTVKSTYTSLADVAKAKSNLKADESEENLPVATRLTIDGEVTLKEYFTPTEEHKMYPEVKGTFIKSIGYDEKYTNGSLVEDGATFTIDIFLRQNPKAEKVKGAEEETGRALLSTYMVIYGGNVKPLDFVVQSEEGVAEYVTDNFKKGETLRVWGNIYNIAHSEIKEIKGFGAAKQEVTTTYRREMVIVGGQPEALNPDDKKAEDKAFDSAIVKIAVGEREAYLAEEKAKAKEREKNKKKNNTGGNSGFKPVKTASGKPSATADDDLPF